MNPCSSHPPSECPFLPPPSVFGFVFHISPHLKREREIGGKQAGVIFLTVCSLNVDSFVGMLVVLFSCAVGGCYGAAYSILLFVLTCFACCHLHLWRPDIGGKNQFSLPHLPSTSFQRLLGFCLGHKLKLTVLFAVNFSEVNWKVIL